jgi:hypothetical protein
VIRVTKGGHGRHVSLRRRPLIPIFRDKTLSAVPGRGICHFEPRPEGNPREYSAASRLIGCRIVDSITYSRAEEGEAFLDLRYRYVRSIHAYYDYDYHYNYYHDDLDFKSDRAVHRTLLPGRKCAHRQRAQERPDERTTRRSDQARRWGLFWLIYHYTIGNARRAHYAVRQPVCSLRCRRGKVQRFSAVRLKTLDN